MFSKTDIQTMTIQCLELGAIVHAELDFGHGWNQLNNRVEAGPDVHQPLTFSI
jgi:hypothetical protein